MVELSRARPPRFEIDRHGWVPGIRHEPSPNCDERPAGEPVELIVIHGISLPPGEFGGADVERLFANAIDSERHPYFGQLVRIARLGALFRAAHRYGSSVRILSSPCLACRRVLLAGATPLQRLLDRNRARGHGRRSLRALSVCRLQRVNRGHTPGLSDSWCRWPLRYRPRAQDRSRPEFRLDAHRGPASPLAVLAAAVTGSTPTGARQTSYGCVRQPATRG